MELASRILAIIKYYSDIVGGEAFAFLFNQYFDFFAQIFFGEGFHLFFSDLIQYLESLLFDPGIDLIGEFGSRGEFPGRVGEDMKSREADLFDDPDRILELFVGFSRKSCDDIGRDPAVGDLSSNIFDEVGIFLNCIMPVHGF